MKIINAMVQNLSGKCDSHLVG